MKRSFRKLRLSVTSSCNFSCTYCVPEKRKHLGATFHPADFYLEKLARIHAVSPLSTLRITGGEPLLYPHLQPLIKGALAMGIAEVSLTTNASLLAPKAGMIADAGINTINVSLDAIDPAVFKTMARSKNYEAVFSGLQAAKSAGLNVKLNMVVQKSVNESQIVPVLEYGMQNNFLVRYIEFMRMGPLANQFEQFFFSKEKLLNTISRAYTYNSTGRPKHGTAELYSISGKPSFGIIANESASFCADCDRLRMDMHGNLYGCLSKPDYISSTELVTDSAMKKGLDYLLSLKQNSFSGSELVMQQIGG